MFKGFKPQGMQKIASKMGYAGRMEEFDSYLQQNPDKQREMTVFQEKAQEMARGGSVRRMAEGGGTTQAAGSNIRPLINNQFQAQTRAIGENGSGGFDILPTTMAIPENGSGGFPPSMITSMMVGEETNQMPDPIAKTMAVGEDGGGPARPINLQPIPQPGPVFTENLPVNTNNPQQAYVPTLGTGAGQVPAFGTGDDPKGITDASAALAQNRSYTCRCCNSTSNDLTRTGSND